MILNKIEDPRDSIAKARRGELLQFARANNVTEITHDMPAVMMRSILKARGLTAIPAPDRPLGQQNQPNPRKMYKDGMLRNTPPAQPAAKPSEPAVIDAEADLARQFQAERAAPVDAKPVDKMSINELRNECRALGIKLARTDNMVSMREKLQVHGQ